MSTSLLTSVPSVHFLSSPATAAFITVVSEKLSTQFGLTNKIYIRSALVPSSVLLSEQKRTASKLYVSFEVTETVSFLVVESHDPVLMLNSYFEKQIPDKAALYIAKFCTLSGNVDLCRSVDRIMRVRRQSVLVADATCRTQSPAYLSAISSCYDDKSQITGTGVLVQGKPGKQGKVRDRFENEETKHIALVTTDRQSGFDRQLALVPYKGAVLNLCSSFWFEQTADIIGNHLVSTPHPYVSIAKQCQPFPIEFVVRAYMTGSTSTSIWKNYQDGVRDYCGHKLPDGMTKNQSLDCCGGPLLTPTTKEEDHDRPIACVNIVKENWMNQEDLDVCANAALKIFQRGQQIASEHGLILVDTKYEFGRSIETGEILLIDEVHTPDSSRYWLGSSFEERIAAGQEPENIDKEFLRLWFAKNCDPYKDETLPEAPRDLVLELSRRYIQLYEMITWKEFDFDFEGEESIGEAIENSTFVSKRMIF